MNKRAKPNNSNTLSYVKYPSCLFSLEKDEIFPYERIAYNVLFWGCQILNEKGYPDNIEVAFPGDLASWCPWSFNASISIKHDTIGIPQSYSINFPTLTPSLLYTFCVIVCKHLHDNAIKNGSDVVKNLIADMQYFFDGASSGVRTYKDQGLAFAIRNIYEFFELDIFHISTFGDIFDLQSKYIALHEIAHAYSIDIVNQNEIQNPSEHCAFELIADLLATNWFFAHYVVNTPDREDYFQLKNVNNYAEAIEINSIISLNTQFSQLLFSAISGAQSNGKYLSQDGGLLHPNSFVRFYVSSFVLLQLIDSYFSDILSKKQLESIQERYFLLSSIVCEAGIVQKRDIDSLFSQEEKENIEKAINIINDKQITELIPITQILSTINGNKMKC